MSEKTREHLKPSLALSIGIIILITAVVSAATLYYKVDVHAPIVMLAVIIALVGYFHLHYSYKELESAAIDSIMASIPSCLILTLVGMLVGLWIKAGIIPGLIYYGLGIISPNIFPLATLIVCAIISLSTGSSWSTEATVGVAMMGIGNGLGINPAFTAGVVVSGAYFGDKMSPLSDTTNLSPAVSGASLFDHIRAMCWTTGPSLVIFSVILLLWGFSYSGNSIDTTRINAIRTIIAAEFPVTLLCIIPPLLVIVASIIKIPAMPGICIGIFASMIMCAAGGVSMGEMWSLSQWGYKAQLSAQIAGLESMPEIAKILQAQGLQMQPELAKDVAAMISRLVGRGGMQNMMWSVSLALIAMAMGGFLEVTGILHTLLAAMTKGVKRVGGLVSATVIASFAANLLTGSQYLSIIIPGRMFKSKYEESGLAPRMLSRSLEDSGTLTSVLIPWNVCGGYAAAVLGVPTLAYAPYAVLNWLTPLVAIFITYLGIGIFWRDKNGEDHREKRVSL
ncbi:Na+/H+ antiporter NhaC [Cloacibacillus evryensis]|uniref:Na+/H+ antiporter NhaC n=1 Tax=Cloacibacillus evryensis TaxID=508460 RepID=A0AAW5K5A0_9BACT|nr:Na+/H+ antiporter NhaC [Cloacibacillus evryensis]EHL64463.1 Na+/H+ antiporter NhaC [Synergistes sp. 3_1_syn1]MCQ4764702.1 Na+/H+ antiporter NhaC [Cloacibacillus evryensis]MCQ4813908.1 Na+/H+ antiporter NhaC [Cloacibacillus evryensis]